jgi:hypothetical protein
LTHTPAGVKLDISYVVEVPASRTGTIGEITMNRALLFVGIAQTFLFVILIALAVSADDKPAAKERFFEMRTYTAAPGKLDALNARFRNHTNKLFMKHGMELIGYWTPTEGASASNTLIYMLAYPSKEAREKSWKAFQEDPDWKAARDASEVDGKLVEKVDSIFLKPTDYSPIK